MVRDESIELARFLNKEYLEAENINDRITDHEQRLARPFDMTTEQRSSFIQRGNISYRKTGKDLKPCAGSKFSP